MHFLTFTALIWEPIEVVGINFIHRIQKMHMEQNLGHFLWEVNAEAAVGELGTRKDALKDSLAFNPIANSSSGSTCLLGWEQTQPLKINLKIKQPFPPSNRAILSPARWIPELGTALGR